VGSRKELLQGAWLGIAVTASFRSGGVGGQSNGEIKMMG
jgi:hypothetical protein